MDWYNASLGIVAGILILIIAVGLFVTRRKKTKPTPPRKKETDIILPACYTCSEDGHLLINGERLASTEKKFYVTEMKRLYVNLDGHVFVELIEDNYDVSMLNYNKHGMLVDQYHFFDGISRDIGYPVTSYKTDDQGRLHVIVNVPV